MPPPRSLGQHRRRGGGRSSWGGGGGGLNVVLVSLLLLLLLPSAICRRIRRRLYAYTPPPLDRVPTFRLYHRGMCCDQIGGGGEVEDARRAIHASIKGNLGTIRIPPLKRPADVLELQSAAEMEDFLKQTAGGDKWALIVFYGSWCQQCQELEPLFHTLPYVYRDRPLVYGRADIANFHELVAKKDQEQVEMEAREQEEQEEQQPVSRSNRKGVVERSEPSSTSTASGRSSSSSSSSSSRGGSTEIVEGKVGGGGDRNDCLRCGGSWFVGCETCGSQGHVVRTAEGFTVADICPTCGGKGKVRCPECGGKCIMCE